MSFGGFDKFNVKVKPNKVIKSQYHFVQGCCDKHGKE